jgi:hypothetical protein
VIIDLSTNPDGMGAGFGLWIAETITSFQSSSHNRTTVLGKDHEYHQGIIRTVKKAY